MLALPAYSNENTITRLDITVPTAPEIIGTYATNVIDMLALPDGFISVGPSITLWDYTNPEPLSAYHTWYGEPISAGIAWHDPYVYVGDSGLNVYELKEQNLQFIENHAYVSSISDLAVANDLLFIADKRQGVRILDLSNPGRPLLLGTTGGFSALAVVPRNSRLYVAGDRDGLMVFDIADPTTPRQIGAYPLTGSLRALAFDRDKVYAAVGSRVRVLEEREVGLKRLFPGLFPMKTSPVGSLCLIPEIHRLRCFYGQPLAKGNGPHSR